MHYTTLICRASIAQLRGQCSMPYPYVIDMLLTTIRFKDNTIGFSKDYIPLIYDLFFLEHCSKMPLIKLTSAVKALSDIEHTVMLSDITDPSVEPYALLNVVDGAKLCIDMDVDTLNGYIFPFNVNPCFMFDLYCTTIGDYKRLLSSMLFRMGINKKVDSILINKACRMILEDYENYIGLHDDSLFFPTDDFKFAALLLSRIRKSYLLFKSDNNSHIPVNDIALKRLAEHPDSFLSTIFKQPSFK